MPAEVQADGAAAVQLEPGVRFRTPGDAVQEEDGVSGANGLDVHARNAIHRTMRMVVLALTVLALAVIAAVAFAQDPGPEPPAPTATATETATATAVATPDVTVDP